MGLEYRIAFPLQDADALNQILKNAPHLSEYDEPHLLYMYRADPAAGTATMPDATAAIRENGFYFCDNCGLPSVRDDILDYLRLCVEAAGRTFVIEDLE